MQASFLSRIIHSLSLIQTVVAESPEHKVHDKQTNKQLQIKRITMTTHNNENTLQRDPSKISAGYFGKLVWPSYNQRHACIIFITGKKFRIGVAVVEKILYHRNPKLGMYA